MPALFLTEEDVSWLVDMETSLAVVEEAFRRMADERAANEPRQRVGAPGVMLHTMSASAEYLGYVGFKAYTTTRQGARFHVALYDAETGGMAALIEADLLGRLRTGAATGVATNCMARGDAEVVGCLGTGKQARTQLKAVCSVRKISRVEVYGRDPDRRRDFAEDVSEYCAVPVVPVHAPDEAAAEKDIVVCATTSKTPVFDGRVLEEGTHVNAVGSNFLTRAEIDVATIRVADHVVCDSIEQCKIEAGNFVEPLEEGFLSWSRVRELADVVVGRETGRARPEEVTLFNSVGLAVEDVALAAKILERARDEDLGQALPF